MKHIIFEPANSYSTAILIKTPSFTQSALRFNYVEPLVKQGIPQSDVIAFNLKYNDAGKAPVALQKEYLHKLLPALDTVGVKQILVADTAYFKTLTGKNQAEPYFGYVLPCKVKGYEHFHIVLGVNYQSLFYNPTLQGKLTMSLKTLSDHSTGNYQEMGTGIIHSSDYPESVTDIAAVIESLHQYPRLTCDIEAFSLRFDEAGIATIAFAWDQHNGIAFACDYTEFISHEDMQAGFKGAFVPRQAVRTLIKNFLTTYKGELIFHNAAYDCKVLIYTLWMDDYLDTEGLLTGLEIMTRSFQDTKIIAYLATNSTAGNVLGLKALAHEFAGNWAVDAIKDVRKVPLSELLRYNLVDCLSTWFVKNKFYPIMIQDKQEELYYGLMLPSQKLLMQIELTGMPMSSYKVQSVKEELELSQTNYLNTITNSPLIKMLNLLVQTSAMEAANAKLKVKQHPLEKFSDVKFNPNSGPQLQRLLYEQMGLPVLDLTDTKQPSTGADTIEKLINHTEEPAYKELLNALINYGKVTKILSTFIPAFENGIYKQDDMLYLHGNFNLGGTVSGRLSSSNPNLQNLPSGSTYGKLIKSCFMAPGPIIKLDTDITSAYTKEAGWVMAGADFNSLEDMISALTTKDKNKLAVYERGFDGHSLRAAYYFRDQCPEIILDDPNSVNSIKKKYPQLRQDSKAPTFLLTYGGTYHGMMSNLGWDEEKSKAIEQGYHDLYQESDAYVQQRLQQASKDGYVEVAFGLRVRTPLLHQVVLGAKGTPYEAAAEGRTAGNAMGQSYGQLNNRAAVDFMQKVWASPYRLDIKPIGLIHDSIYLLIRDDINIVEWANRELIISMKWQELSEIQHPVVKLGSNLDLFWPDWSNAITLPNEADQATIYSICQTAKLELTMKGKV